MLNFTIKASCRFGQKKLYENLELHLGVGITALFGRNGSGKSTFLKQIAGTLKMARFN